MANLVSRVWDAFVNKRQSYSDHLYQQMSDFSYNNESGEVVTVDRGSKISSVFTPVNAISQDIAKLPFGVFKEVDDVRKKEKRHPVYKLIHDSPNENTTAFNFWYSIMWSTLTKGNGLALIVRDDKHVPVEIRMIEWKSPHIVEEKGSLFYKINDMLVPSRDLLHFKMYTLDGIVGVSPITWNAALMGYKLKQDKYSAKIIGTKGNGFISSEGLTAEQGKEVTKGMRASIEAGQIPFLGTRGRTQWNQQLMTPNEGQYIETKMQSNTEILGIYRFPPAMAQNYERATYANASQQDSVYVKHTLTPWARMIEQECNRKLFTENNKVSSSPYYTSFNFNGILKGDIEARADYYKTMKDGIMTSNEIRKLENLPPVPDGNKVMMQGAMIPLGTEPQENENNTASEQKEEQKNGYERLHN